MAIDMDRAKLLLGVVSHNNMTYKSIMAEAQAELRELDEEAKIEMPVAARPGMPADQQGQASEPEPKEEVIRAKAISNKTTIADRRA